MGRWFFGCPAYQSGPGMDVFRIDVSMASHSFFLDLFLLLVEGGTPEKPSAHFTTAKTYVGTYI